MKTGDRKRKFAKDTILYAIISSSALFLILIIFFRDSVDFWIALLFSGGFFVCMLFTTLGELIVYSSDFRESPDCCFSILQETMDRGRTANAEILGLSYYKSQIDAEGEGKISVSMMLRILNGEKEPYELQIETDLPKDIVIDIKEGDMIPILIDRFNPQKITLDLEMMLKEVEEDPESD
jgi:hypothetical protein